MTLAWMFTRMILVRFCLILFGISAFVIMLDVATYVDEILKLKGNDLSALADYALLILPKTLSTFLGMSVLLALLLTLTELSYRSELTVIWTSGASPYRVIAMLLPLGLFLGGCNFLLTDIAVPRAAPELHSWGIGDYGSKQLTIGEKDPIWMRSGHDILRAADSNPQATELDNVIIFRRDAAGLLTEQIMAAKAVLQDSRWELSDVVVYYQQNLPPNRLAKLIYSGAMKPAAAGARSGDPEEMSISDLDYFIANAGFGIRPAHVYQTWWHKRTTLLFSAWLMIAICVPLALRFRRAGGIGYLFTIGVALGFGFFMLDGISLTMGELGLLPPWLAAWLPLAIFGGAASAMLLRAEALR
jgi:lipopolysaccharide export system permease protein